MLGGIKRIRWWSWAKAAVPKVAFKMVKANADEWLRFLVPSSFHKHEKNENFF